MKIDFSLYRKNLLFLPLGGTDEIGINLNLYHYNGKWIMIDCGIGFTDEYPGVDIIVANLSFLKQENIDLLGLIITHVHEDHIGAIPYLWHYIKCPIFGTKFIVNFLKLRLEDFAASGKLKIFEIDIDSEINLDPFLIKTIPLTHSTPEAQGILIKTEVGNVFHTGDWNFDYSPVIGGVVNKERLKQCGDDGILALMCDSTNVFEENISKSEGELEKSLIDVISDAVGLVVVTIFASNIARIITLISIAKKVNRKVALCGRSLFRMVQIAYESQYLDESCFIDSRDISRYKRNEVLVIATGCQGEYLSAVNKMAKKNHPDINLAPNDKVIFSSKIIPGNEKKISNVLNLLIKLGVDVITEKDYFVHVSGHACIDELKEMYDLLRPQISVPIHGDAIHIYEHVKLAKELGVKHTIRVHNGLVINLDKNFPKVIGSVKSGYLCVDGNCLLSNTSKVFKIRKKLSNSGIVIINLILNKKLKLFKEPKILFPGCLDEVNDDKFIKFIKSKLLSELNSCNKIDDFYKISKSCIKRILKEKIGKEPEIVINIENIEKI